MQISKADTEEDVQGTTNTCAKSPDFKFIIQWTGVRSGGHHSFEDQREPLFEKYMLIRELRT